MPPKQMKLVYTTSHKKIPKKPVKKKSTNKKSVKKKKKIVPIPERRLGIVENFIVVWLDAHINLSHADYQNSITKFRQIVNSIETFTDANQCRTYLKKIKDEKVFLIVSGSIGREIISTIENITNLETIYVFCCDRQKHLIWSRHYRIIKDVFTDIDLLCRQLKIDIQQAEANLISISIFSKDQSPTQDLNSLDSSFMYSKLLSEILLEIEHNDQEAKINLVEFCQIQYRDNKTELKNINEFNRTYSSSKAILWYTKECFIYSMLNKALRTLDIEVTIKMGFYLRDLHQEIQRLQKKQKYSQSLIVYRGQKMSNEEFEKLSNCKGGLLSFNNFLSTTLDRQVALSFARQNSNNSTLGAILFHMEINPSVCSTPFALIEHQGDYDEKEVLFSMHTVFRISEIKQRQDGIWKVELQSTANNDQQLQQLTEHMRNQTKGLPGWDRLGTLMMAMGQYEKAEEFYQLAHAMTSEDDWEKLAYLHSQLGHIRDELHDPDKALEQYEEALDIQLDNLPEDHPSLSIAYTGIGSALHSQNQLDAALEHFQYALHIASQNWEYDSLEIAKIHNYIGNVYKDQREYTEALKSYTQTLNIRKQYLPKGHPSLAIIYNNIGSVHESMADYSKALTYYEQTFEIERKSLPSNHPSLAIIYHNIANVLDHLGRYEEAIRKQTHAVQIVRELYDYHDERRQEEERDLQRMQAKLETLQLK